MDVDSNTLSDGATRIPLEPRAMEVLRYLCRHPGAVIPAEELLQACWGSAEFGDNPVHKAITQLRRALGDSSTEPRYIETIRKRGYRAIADVVEAEEDGQVVWTSGSPFRGLEPFQENHAAIFFGRVQATARLKELVEKQTRAGWGMALVLGPSGSGKTSLVRAGLMPQLMQSADEGSSIALDCTLYLDCADLGEGSIFYALAAVLIDAEFSNMPFFPEESADSLSRKLEFGEIEEVFSLLPHIEKPVVGIFVDRLEAIFHEKNISNNGRERFIELLQKLSKRKSMLVIMACRNDFYPDIIALPNLMELKTYGGHFDLTVPDGVDIAQIIRLPAKAAQLTYETDPSSGASLDDVLCDAARGSPDTLPLLQYCLNELYRQRDENGVLRFEVFQQLGGIEGAIGMRAEQIITGLTSAQAAALPKILSLLVNIGDEQSAITARRAAWSLLQTDEERDLVRAMIEARLFVSELTGDIPSFGVAHEALLRRWPRVADWIEQHRNSIQLRTRISGQAERWIVAGQSKDLLLPKGIQVSQATSLLETDIFPFSRHEQDFIRNSAKRALWNDRLRLGAMVTIVSLAILTAIFGLVARSSQQDAIQHKVEAEGLVGFMLGEFSEKLRPLGRLDLLDEISNRSLQYISSTSNDVTSTTAAAQRAKALQVIAEVNIARAKPEKAQEALLLARDILEKQILSMPENKDLLKDMGANSFWLGQLEFNRSNWNKSEEYMIDYQKIGDRLMKIDPADSDSWIEQSYAYNSLGSISMKRANVAEAAASFSKSVELKKKALAVQKDNKKLRADLANSLSWLAEAKAKLGELKAAMILFEEERKLLAPLQELEPDNSLWTYRLAMALTHQGELRLALGEVPAAKNNLLDAEGLLRKITEKDPTNRSWQLNFYTVQLKIIEHQLTSNNDTENLKKINELKEKLESLRSLEPKRTRTTLLISLAENIQAEILAHKGDMKGAMNNIDKALDKLYVLHEKDKKDPILSTLLANTILNKSDLVLNSKNKELAFELCHKAKNILQTFGEESSDYRLLAAGVRSHLCTGNINDSKQQKKLDIMSYRDAKHLKYISLHSPKKG
ncbi:winged helix-turn-helix domain-containing protein [Massilia sp. MB5]|uniref:nSTAND1 domain-containing NTPase n=1 Tax=Massilia sp. MB5 TaxID=2919578 RepID=UPI001F118E4A|nr:winged helix-turn-helix domain-containing protein [Massilia sp. MB5]UMR29820.1 winged helix-turn-helix domain-containing protein [Massilia sp. MB5]